MIYLITILLTQVLQTAQSGGRGRFGFSRLSRTTLSTWHIIHASPWSNLWMVQGEIQLVAV